MQVWLLDLAAFVKHMCKLVVGCSQSRVLFDDMFTTKVYAQR